MLLVIKRRPPDKCMEFGIMRFGDYYEVAVSVPWLRVSHDYPVVGVILRSTGLKKGVRLGESSERVKKERECSDRRNESRRSVSHALRKSMISMSLRRRLTKWLVTEDTKEGSLAVHREDWLNSRSA
jgi:hypothetical protein